MNSYGTSLPVGLAAFFRPSRSWMRSDHSERGSAFLRSLGTSKVRVMRDLETAEARGAVGRAAFATGRSSFSGSRAGAAWRAWSSCDSGCVGSGCGSGGSTAACSGGGVGAAIGADAAATTS